ncbi:hypothetical protein L596_009679 [Steinernema carpocapsae]|uniref:ditrans,polycis-polyprenyl diphosphate synthase [(2E,6E)-farnesyldiphosphate specific] n=1 Tax=Steinernema carpocapsae TaxID=34508 RepID=A0A4U5PG13_STECR|nr:hypothetical protein L596_009679 [Steinernema carpocapsae]
MSLSPRIFDHWMEAHNRSLLQKLFALTSLVLIWLLPKILDAAAVAFYFVRRLFSKEVDAPLKVPSHIGFLFTEESEITIEALSEMITQCAIRRIPQVSFYDPFDRCLAMEERLHKAVTSIWTLKERTDSTVRTPSVIFDSSKTKISGSGQELLRVALLTSTDGKPALVDTCKKICTDSSLPLESIDAACISQKLKEVQPAEPDLLVAVGSVSTFAGFPPWSVRVTEIVQIPTLVPVSSDLFVQFLQAFARRDRRLGR